LLDLPDELLSSIWKDSRRRVDDISLLAASTRTRDALLKSVSRLQLKIYSNSSIPGSARLLKRVCQLAQSGMQLELHNFLLRPVVRALLQPALDCDGYSNVHQLSVSQRPIPSLSSLGQEVHIGLDLGTLCSAFPALRMLR
jgi:hypothetical protein